MSRQFWHKILGLFGGLFSEDSGDFRGRGGEGAFSTVGEGSSEVFEAPPSTPVPSAPCSPSFITTEGKHPRGSRGHNKGDRRSWEVERIDPGRIPLALIRSGSGQAGHGPWT